MMKKIVFLILLMSLSVSSVDLTVTVIFDAYRTGEIEMKNLYLSMGEQTRYVSGPYSLQLLDENDTVIENLNFDLGFVVYKDPGGTIDVDKTGDWLNIQFNESAQKLQIVHNGTILYEKADLQNALCNSNGRCDEHENMLSCSPDCFAKDKDNFCSALSDGVCDPDCTSLRDKDCPYDGRGLDDLKTKDPPSAPNDENQEPEENGGQLAIILKLGVIAFSTLFLFAILSIFAYLVYRQVKKN
ncbi:MAG: hypothetical protein ABIH99_02615 [Candidatus Micrarchaeota archaeon]